MKSYRITSIALLISTLILISCAKDEEPVESGNVRIDITDSPIDNQEVQGAFVTISEIYLDDQKLEAFSKTTLDLMAYRNGTTYTLMESLVPSKDYHSLKLILDYDSDENGNEPGCYIITEGGIKHGISSGDTELSLENVMTVESSTNSELVIDFDLRKCITSENGTGDQYNFVTHTELEKSVRVSRVNETGKISGSCTDNLDNSGKIIVYAYVKGTFDQSTETMGQGESNIRFLHSVTSGEVNSNGKYSLNFLPNGKYELYFASFYQNVEGDSEFHGSVQVDVIGSIQLSSVEVKASDSTSVDVNVTGILPLP